MTDPLATALLDALRRDPEQLEALRELIGIAPDTRSPYLTAPQAAEYLCCSVSRVRKLTMLDELPAHRDGGRVLYRRDELDAYVESGGASTGR